MRVQSLGYRTDLTLLRLGGSVVIDRPDRLVVRTPQNPAFWWGNFLLLAHAPSHDDVDRVLAGFAAEFPQADHVAIGVDDPHATVDGLATLADRGFDTEAASVMTAADVHEPPHPNRDAGLRELHSDRDWTDSVELRMRCDAGEFDPVTHRPFVVAKAASNRRLVAAGHATWFGAFVDGALVAQLGIVRAGDGLARFQTVETDPQHRRRGLCGTLVHHAARAVIEQGGARSLVLVADPDDVAIRVYRSVGFAGVETQLQATRRP
ncbi:GNAT family N-acetyltransferase [uncultured Jatrophihabitans sp.]|uniref:GNAT family N-acetyltransferase n=1 Tax=uncultured Jatrophihabitans sp. TaxID=1610747 RepID=UPI0035C98B26